MGTFYMVLAHSQQGKLAKFQGNTIRIKDEAEVVGISKESSRLALFSVLFPISYIFNLTGSRS